jgi:urease accessory protein UreE
VELELVRVRLHDRAGDDVGLVELPLGWVLELGDLLVDDEGRLVQVTDVVPFPAASALAALVSIAPAPKRAR